MENSQLNKKDESVIGLLHSFVSLGVLSLCIGFIVKTLVTFKYGQHDCWENIIYLVSGLFALLPLIFLIFYSTKSIARFYLEPLALKAHWFYIGIIIMAGASMTLVFPAFNFLNSSLDIAPTERTVTPERVVPIERTVTSERVAPIERTVIPERVVPKSSDSSVLEYIKILFAVFIAVVGWIAAHHFTAKRDLNNSRRLARIEALSSCYKIFVRSGIDGVLIKKNGSEVVDRAGDIEDAILMIHLYGSQEQSELANQYVNDMSTNQNADSTKLVDSLRKDIRGMLGEQDFLSKPSYLKINRN